MHAVITGDMDAQHHSRIPGANIDAKNRPPSGRVDLSDVALAVERLVDQPVEANELGIDLLLGKTTVIAETIYVVLSINEGIVIGGCPVQTMSVGRVPDP